MSDLKEAQSDSISVRLSFISQWWDFAPVPSSPPTSLCIQVGSTTGNYTAQNSRQILNLKS